MSQRWSHLLMKGPKKDFCSEKEKEDSFYSYKDNRCLVEAPYCKPFYSFPRSLVYSFIHRVPCAKCWRLTKAARF
jgi:hypothetical protein